MKFPRKSFKLAAIAAAYLLFVSPNAFAYLDPASGSYIIQIVLAALIGGFFVIKQYFSRIKLFFKNFFKR